MLALRARHGCAFDGALHNEGAEPTCEQRDNALIIGRLFKTVTTKTLVSELRVDCGPFRQSMYDAQAKDIYISTTRNPMTKTPPKIPPFLTPLFNYLFSLFIFIFFIRYTLIYLYTF